MKKFVFKEGISNRGCYATILFDVELKTDERSGVVLTYLADRQWESAAKAGTDIFNQYYPLDGKLYVTIHEIGWIPVDTDYLTVLFAVVKALTEALGLPTKVHFDKLNESFVFEERRKGGQHKETNT